MDLTNLSQLPISEFSITEFATSIKPLVFFTLGMVLYTVFIFQFYRFLARRDIIKLHLHKNLRGFFGFLAFELEVLFNLIERLILIPIMIFFWFAVLASFLLFMSRGQSIDKIILTSISIVAVVRVTAYYSEDLSRDVAKMVPFALLGMFVIDASYFSVSTAIEAAKQIPSLWKHMVYYLIFVVFLEFMLRLLNWFFGLFGPHESSQHHKG